MAYAQHHFKKKSQEATARFKKCHPTRVKTIQRRCDLKRKYGLTEKEWNELFLHQNNCCAACGSSHPHDPQNRWHTDHNHKTGEIRGILCRKCNITLGYVEDNHTHLLLLARYIGNKKWAV